MSRQPAADESITAVVVTGSGPFPLGMLRRMQAWPATNVDADTISRSYLPGSPNPYIVRLHTKRVPAQAMLDRWIKVYDFEAHLEPGPGQRVEPE